MEQHTSMRADRLHRRVVIRDVGAGAVKDLRDI